MGLVNCVLMNGSEIEGVARVSVTLGCSWRPTVLGGAEFGAIRADVFMKHCRKHHQADFEVCTDVSCRWVVQEEVRRGLLSPDLIWPPLDDSSVE